MATFPTLHLNGTNKTDLRDGYLAAHDAIDEAIDALVNVDMNARDYYMQEPGAYYQARQERTEALKKLRHARAYTSEMLAGICDQMGWSGM